MGREYNRPLISHIIKCLPDVPSFISLAALLDLLGGSGLRMGMASKRRSNFSFPSAVMGLSNSSAYFERITLSTSRRRYTSSLTVTDKDTEENDNRDNDNAKTLHNFIFTQSLITARTSTD